MVGIALPIKLTSHGPVIFKQRRYGLDGQRNPGLQVPHDDRCSRTAASVHQATRTDSRVTRVGRFLRRYSLDELPQLFNVLSGDDESRRPAPARRGAQRGIPAAHQGLHGSSQGAAGHHRPCADQWLPRRDGRVEDMQARVNYDLEYLRRWSPLLDLKILALTAVRVLRDEKAY